jgi:hypothetical protein
MTLPVDLPFPLGGQSGAPGYGTLPATLPFTLGDTRPPTLFYVPPTLNIAPGLRTPLGVPGTPLWDALNNPFLDTEVVNAYNCQTVDYPASLFDAGYSYETGVANTIDAINATSGPFVLAGASQGAAIISAVYNEIRYGSLTNRRDDLLAGVTFGNPCREGGHTFPGCLDPGGHGIRAPQWRLSHTEVSWWDFAAPGDIICTNGNDFIGELATAIFEYVWSQGLDGMTLPDEYAAAMSALTAAVNEAIAEAKSAPFTLISQTFNGVIEALTWGIPHDSYPTYKPLPLNSATTIELASNYLVQIASPTQPPPTTTPAPPIFVPPTFNHMPPGRISNYAAELMRLGPDAVVKFISPGGRLIWHLAGGKAPMPGVEPGLVMQSVTGQQAPFKLIDLQGARQPGVTNTDRVPDPMELDFVFSANAPLGPDFLPDPDGMSRVIRWWFESWANNRQGKVTHYTPEMGEWWCNARQFKSLPDTFKLSYRQTGEQVLTWAARADDAYWWSFDSTDELYYTAGPGETQSGWLHLCNRGTEDGWERFLFYGPGSVAITEPNGNVVTFGPALDGQVVLITTRPGLRSVIDVTPQPLPSQTLTGAQQVLQDLIEFVTNNNTPPLLQLFLSWAGIMPPQGQLYSLMKNRFNCPIPGVEEAQPPQNTRIGVKFLPGVMRPAAFNGNTALLPPAAGDTIEPVANKTRLVAALTPARMWPE